MSKNTNAVPRTSSDQRAQIMLQIQEKSQRMRQAAIMSPSGGQSKNESQHDSSGYGGMTSEKSDSSVNASRSVPLPHAHSRSLNTVLPGLSSIGSKSAHANRPRLSVGGELGHPMSNEAFGGASSLAALAEEAVSADLPVPTPNDPYPQVSMTGRASFGGVSGGGISTIPQLQPRLAGPSAEWHETASTAESTSSYMPPPINSIGTRQHSMVNSGPSPRANSSDSITSLVEGINQNQGSASSGNNFKVCIRVRPPLLSELESAQQSGFMSTVAVSPDHRQIVLCESFPDQLGGPTTSIPANIEAASPHPFHRFSFDYVFGEESHQEEVYENTAKELVASTLQGYNSTVFAYGQTGTGKTYTMEGIDAPQHLGIIPRAVSDIFDFIMNQANAETKFLVRASYLQIYNEQIMDLLAPDRGNLQIREDKQKGVFVEGLSEWMVRSAKEIKALIKRGGSMRATGATKMNEVSSRSHALFIIVVEQHSIAAGGVAAAAAAAASTASPAAPQSGRNRRHSISSSSDLKSPQQPQTASNRSRFRVGKLNLVDLAGSERVALTGASGQRLEESKRINQSLSALGNVIAALTTDKGRRAHVPYRDSKLTRILEDSLGGNCKTTMMATLSPSRSAFLESLSTVKFAARAKQIKNDAKVNEDLDQTALLRKYEHELRRLRAELAEKVNMVQGVRDRSHELKLELERNKAEADREAVLQDLATLTEELSREKNAKEELETKIKAMNSRMLIGGGPQLHLHAALALQEAMKAEQGRVTELYRKKIVELEKEREGIADDKRVAQQYKQLLVKQRQILIQLTSRLRERDQYIVRLQEDAAAYEQHRRVLEKELLRLGRSVPVPQFSADAVITLSPESQQKPLDDDVTKLLIEDESVEVSFDKAKTAVENNRSASQGIENDSRLAEAKSTIESLRHELEMSKKELNDLRTEKVDIEAERRRFENDLEAALEREQRWVTESSRWHDEKSKFQQDMTRAKEVITTLQSHKEQLLAARKRLESKLKVEFEARVRAAVDAKLLKLQNQNGSPHQVPSPTSAGSPSQGQSDNSYNNSSVDVSNQTNTVINVLTKLPIPDVPEKLPTLQDAERFLQQGKDISSIVSPVAQMPSSSVHVNPDIGSAAEGGATEHEESVRSFAEQVLEHVNAAVLSQAGSEIHPTSLTSTAAQSSNFLQLPNVLISIESDFLRAILSLLKYDGDVSSLLRSLLRRQMRKYFDSEEEVQLLREELSEVLRDAQEASIEVMDAVNRKRRLLSDEQVSGSSAQVLNVSKNRVNVANKSHRTLGSTPLTDMAIPEEDTDTDQELDDYNDANVTSGQATSNLSEIYEGDEDDSFTVESLSLDNSSGKASRSAVFAGSKSKEKFEDMSDSDLDTTDDSNVLGEEAAASMAAAAAGAVARVQQLERRVASLLRNQDIMREELEEEIRTRDAVVLALKLQYRKLEAERTKMGADQAYPLNTSINSERVNESSVSNASGIAALSTAITSSGSVMASIAVAMSELDRRERLLKQKLREVSARENEATNAIVKVDEKRQAELIALTDRQEALDEAVAVYEVQIQALESHSKELSSRLEMQLQERKALRIIIEQRIKLLVDQLNARVMADYQSQGALGGDQSREKMVVRTMSALHKLVTATANALRQAEESEYDLPSIPKSPDVASPTLRSYVDSAASHTDLPSEDTQALRKSATGNAHDDKGNEKLNNSSADSNSNQSRRKSLMDMGAIPESPMEATNSVSQRIYQDLSIQKFPVVQPGISLVSTPKPPVSTHFAAAPKAHVAPNSSISKFLPPTLQVPIDSSTPQPRMNAPSPQSISAHRTPSMIAQANVTSGGMRPSQIPAQFLPPGSQGAQRQPAIPFNQSRM